GRTRAPLCFRPKRAEVKAGAYPRDLAAWCPWPEHNAGEISWKAAPKRRPPVVQVRSTVTLPARELRGSRAEPRQRAPRVRPAWKHDTARHPYVRPILLWPMQRPWKTKSYDRI